MRRVDPPQKERGSDPLAEGSKGSSGDECTHFTTDGGSSHVRFPGMSWGTLQLRLHT